MILMYHKVDSTAPTQWWVDSDTFYRQMLDLKDRHVVLLDDYDPTAPDQVVITFDGVYANICDYAGPILQAFGYPFELFVTGDCIGQDNAFDRIEPHAQFADLEQLRRLIEMGGRLQWHTATHRKLDATPTSDEWREVVNELEVPDHLQALQPEGFKWFAYPHGDFSEEVYGLVKRRFKGAVSCVQGDETDRHRLNRLTVTNQTCLRQQKVAVIVVSYNYGQYLSEALESVLQQTLIPDEILIVDDASTDETSEVARKYVQLYGDRMRLMQNEKNLGIVPTFNKAIAQTSAELVCFLGADNRMFPNYLERLVSTLHEAGPGTAVVYTDFALFGERAAQEYALHAPGRRGRQVGGRFYEVVFPDFTEEELAMGDFIHGSSLYRRRAFDQVGGYQLGGTRPEDANLFRRMVGAGWAAAKAHGTWLEYRQHDEDQANIVARTRSQLEFYRVYARRLEWKVKALERSFGIFSPLVKAASYVEKLAFEMAVSVARKLRRRRKS